MSRLQGAVGVTRRVAVRRGTVGPAALDPPYETDRGATTSIGRFDRPSGFGDLPFRITVLPSSDHLVVPTDRGLFCAAGDFYIDPWRPVDRAVVTHAHSDHATPGCERYLCSDIGVEVLRPRVHAGARIEGAAYGTTTTINGVNISLHPAGHSAGQRPGARGARRAG